MNTAAIASNLDLVSLPFADPQEKIMSVHDLAAETKVTVSAVYSWIRRGKIVARKVGGATILLRSEVYNALKGTKYELAR